MKRILTLLVMALLIIATPQASLAQAKKTTKKTTKTTNIAKNSKSPSKTNSGTKSAPKKTLTSTNNQTYPVPKSYTSYANKTPEISIRPKEKDSDGFSSAQTSVMTYKDVIYGGRDVFFLSAETKKEMEWWVAFSVYSFNKEAIALAKYMRDNNIEHKTEHTEITFSNGTSLSGDLYVFNANGEKSFGIIGLCGFFFDPEVDDDHAVLAFTFYPHLLGNSTSPASAYFEHYRYVSNLFMNNNITNIKIGNNITIPIDPSKWGTKHTMTALFKAIAKDSENYESFDLTKPTSASSSSSSSSTYSTPSSTTSSSSDYGTSSTPSSSTYNTPSYYYNYGSKPKKRFWGVSAGYVQKQWQLKEGRNVEKMGFWDDSKVVHGVQAGLRLEPYFKFGLGLNTGLLYEFYYTKSQPMMVDGYNVYGEMQEHALYMPFHLTYRLKFDDFHIYAFGGAGLDYGIMSKAELKENGTDYVGYDNSPLYESEDAPDWRRFNASYEFGGGLRYKAVQLQFTMSRGFLNMSHDDSYKLYQNKPMMFSLGFMF